MNTQSSKNFLLPVLITAIFLLPACITTSKKPCPVIPTLQNPEQYLKQVLASASGEINLSGFATITVTNRKKITAKTIFFLKSPDNIRFEFLNFFNQLALLTIIRHNRIFVFNPSSNTLYTGSADRNNIHSLFGISISPAEIIQYFTGHPSFNYPATSKINYEKSCSAYFFDIESDNTEQFIWIEHKTGKISHYELATDGHIKIRCLYEYNGTGKYPSQAIISLPEQGTEVKIKYNPDSIKTAPVPDDMFVFSPSSKPVRLPLEKFFTGNQ